MSVFRGHINTLLKNTFKTAQLGVRIRSLSSKLATSNQDALNYCTNIVRTLSGTLAFFTDRQHDYENFLATLLMTTAIRSPALVVRSFNVEIARVQDQTSDPQTALFRLQFWQDTLRDIFKNDQTLTNIPANPVAQELFKVCSCYKIPKRNLERLIGSRSNLVKTKYFKSLEEMEKYADDTVSVIYYSILSVAGVANVHADHAASHLGKAQGLANILRSVHVANHQKIVYFPMDLLMKHKVSQETVLRGMDTEGIRGVTYEIASCAMNHLRKARSINIPRIANQIFLPGIAVDIYLKNLQKYNFDVFHKSLTRASATLPLRFYFNRLVNKY